MVHAPDYTAPFLLVSGDGPTYVLETLDALRDFARRAAIDLHFSECRSTEWVVRDLYGRAVPAAACETTWVRRIRPIERLVWHAAALGLPIPFKGRRHRSGLGARHALHYAQRWRGVLRELQDAREEDRRPSGRAHKNADGNDDPWQDNPTRACPARSWKRHRSHQWKTMHTRHA